MGTFNDLSPYYTEDNNELHRRMEESYRQNITLYQQFWNEADIDTRFAIGDQTLWQQIYGTLPLQNRRQFQFNRVRRILNMVTGYQRRNRKTTIVTPQHDKDQQSADDMSGVIQWVMNNSNGYNTLSDAFQGAITAGLNFLNVWVDYRFDPINGDIRIDNEGYNAMMIDGTFKKQDLSDANFIWKRKWMSKKQISSLLPGREKEIMGMPYTANRDDKFIFLPENFQYGIRALLPYDEYYYLDFREVKLIHDTDTGETMEWEGDKESLKMFLDMYPQVKTTTIQKQTCRLAIAVSNRIMYDGPNPYGSDKYPFIGVFGYFCPEIPYFSLKMQGMVRGLRDAQYLYNRKKIIECDLLESQINSGIKYKENALVDPNDAFLTGQGRALALRASANMDDVQVIQPPRIDQSMMALSENLAQEISQISGVNEELLGSAMDEKAGILSMLRQGAGLTTLQVLFDQLDMSQKLLGELCEDYIQSNFSKGKVEKILGRPASPEFEDKMFPKYNWNVEEGFLTTSQKQMHFMQLMELQNAGIPIPHKRLINAAQIQDKNELIKDMQEEAEQQKQQQQQAFQTEQQNQQMVAESLHAKATSDYALAEERISKIPLDEALSMERIARAQEDRDSGSLAKIKAAKELESMDLGHLRELLDMLTKLQAQDKAKQDMSHAAETMSQQKQRHMREMQQMSIANQQTGLPMENVVQ